MLSDRRSLVHNPLLRYSFILQVVVSRNQRMAGVSNYASKTAKNDAPERVKVVPGYWSFNYLNVGLQTVLSCLLLIGAGYYVSPSLPAIVPSPENTNDLPPLQRALYH